MMKETNFTLEPYEKDEIRNTVFCFTQSGLNSESLQYRLNVRYQIDSAYKIPALKVTIACLAIILILIFCRRSKLFFCENGTIHGSEYHVAIHQCCSKF